MRYQYSYNCTSPESLKELDFILDNSKEISADYFLRHVSLKQINQALMYGINYPTVKKLKSDYSVSFYEINKRGINAVIFVNSSIDYIFKLNLET